MIYFVVIVIFSIYNLILRQVQDFFKAYFFDTKEIGARELIFIMFS